MKFTLIEVLAFRLFYRAKRTQNKNKLLRSCKVVKSGIIRLQD